MIVSISVVSHGQINLILSLMQDLEKFCPDQSIELILTLNIQETIAFNLESFSYPVKVIKNSSPKGFGANHNQAFKCAQGDFFCVVNPDIRLHQCPLHTLISCLKDRSIGAVAPKVFGPSGSVEDSARHFPTLQKIVSKLRRRAHPSDYLLQDARVDVDWVAGMFMVFTRQVFERLRGFNERYFLYYEDVDLCARLHLAGFRVVVEPSAHVVHHAQRSSHRSLKYLRWHVASLLRFLSSREYRELNRLKRI